LEGLRGRLALRGLHPLIAEVILVAVVVAVALAAVAWIVGVYRFAQSRAETVLRIYNATLYVHPNGSCVLTALLRAEGGSVEIAKVWGEPLGVIEDYTITPTPEDGRLRPGVIYQFRGEPRTCGYGGVSQGKVWIETRDGRLFVGFYNVVVIEEG
jgi:hypothetical protein